MDIIKKILEYKDDIDKLIADSDSLFALVINTIKFFEDEKQDKELIGE